MNRCTLLHSRLCNGRVAYLESLVSKETSLCRLWDLTCACHFSFTVDSLTSLSSKSSVVRRSASDLGYPPVGATMTTASPKFSTRCLRQRN